MLPIRVLIADDHQLFIDGIAALLQEVPHIKVVARALDGNEVLEKLAKTEVDIALLDISMPGLDGIETAEIVASNFPLVKVIALSMHNQVPYVVKMLHAGAQGYLLKHIHKADLIKAIETVYNGGIFYSPEVAVHLVNKLFREGVGNVFPQDDLTEREKDIIRQIVKGEPNKIIGDTLNISEATVKTHRQRILKKLQLKNTSELIHFAHTHNLV